MEHKSWPDKNIHIQLLDYLTRIYSKMKKLEVVIPYFFYHGAGKWTIADNFAEAFDLTVKELELFAKYIPNFHYELLDLSKTDIDNLMSSLAMKAILFTFRNIWVLGDISKIDELLLLSKDLFSEKSELKLIQKLLTYIYRTKEVQPDKIRDRIESIVSKEKGGIAMTTAEVLIEKGIEKGKLEDAEIMLEKAYPIQDISDITGLSQEQIQELQKNMSG